MSFPQSTSCSYSVNLEKCLWIWRQPSLQTPTLFIAFTARLGVVEQEAEDVGGSRVQDWSAGEYTLHEFLASLLPSCWKRLICSSSIEGAWVNSVPFFISVTLAHLEHFPSSINSVSKNSLRQSCKIASVELGHVIGSKVGIKSNLSDVWRHPKYWICSEVAMWEKWCNTTFESTKLSSTHSIWDSTEGQHAFSVSSDWYIGPETIGTSNNSCFTFFQAWSEKAVCTVSITLPFQHMERSQCFEMSIYRVRLRHMETGWVRSWFRACTVVCDVVDYKPTFIHAKDSHLCPCLAL